LARAGQLPQLRRQFLERGFRFRAERLTKNLAMLGRAAPRAVSADLSARRPGIAHPSRRAFGHSMTSMIAMSSMTAKIIRHRRLL
jgi:hypothetical protein